MMGSSSTCVLDSVSSLLTDQSSSLVRSDRRSSNRVSQQQGGPVNRFGDEGSKGKSELHLDFNLSRRSHIFSSMTTQIALQGTPNN